MLVTIRIEHGSPLTGRVAIDGEEEESFEGWLQLLKVLSDAVNPADAAAAP